MLHDAHTVDAPEEGRSLHSRHALAHMNALRHVQTVDAPSPYGDPMTGGVNTGNVSADAPRFSWKVAPALARSLRTRVCVRLCAPSDTARFLRSRISMHTCKPSASSTAGTCASERVLRFRVSAIKERS